MQYGDVASVQGKEWLSYQLLLGVNKLHTRCNRGMAAPAALGCAGVGSKINPAAGLTAELAIG